MWWSCTTELKEPELSGPLRSLIRVAFSTNRPSWSFSYHYVGVVPTRSYQMLFQDCHFYHSLKRVCQAVTCKRGVCKTVTLETGVYILFEKCTLCFKFRSRISKAPSNAAALFHECCCAQWIFAIGREVSNSLPYPKIHCPCDICHRVKYTTHLYTTSVLSIYF